VLSKTDGFSVKLISCNKHEVRKGEQGCCVPPSHSVHTTATLCRITGGHVMSNSKWLGSNSPVIGDLAMAYSPGIQLYKTATCGFGSASMETHLQPSAEAHKSSLLSNPAQSEPPRLPDYRDPVNFRNSHVLKKLSARGSLLVMGSMNWVLMVQWHQIAASSTLRAIRGEYKGTRQ